MRFKNGDIVTISKCLLNGAIIRPIGIQKREINQITGSSYKLFHNFKENEIGVIVSGPFDDFDTRSWDLFVNNGLWRVDEVHLNLINENESNEKI